MKIVGGVLAGWKAKAGAASGLDSSATSDGPKIVEKRKKGKRARNSVLEAPASYSLAPTAEVTTNGAVAPADRESSTTVSIGADGNEILAVAASASSVDEDGGSVARERTGITWERLQNVLFPYVAGIAVRP